MSGSPSSNRGALARVAPRALIALGLVLGLAGAGVWRAFADPGRRQLLDAPIDLGRVGRTELSLTAPASPGHFEVVIECERTDSLSLRALDRALLGDDRTGVAPSLRVDVRVLADGQDLGLTNVVGGRWGRDTVGRYVTGFAASPGHAYRLAIEVEGPAPELAATNPRVEVVEAFEKDRFIEGSIRSTLGRLSALPLLVVGFLFSGGGVVFERRRRGAPAR